MLDRRQIQGYKGQKGAEVHDLDRPLPLHGQRAKIGQATGNRHVVRRATALGIQMAKDFPRQHIVTAHAVEQAHCTQ